MPEPRPNPAPGEHPPGSPAARALRAAADWTGRMVRTSDGHDVGRVEALLVDREAGRPQWLVVEGGLIIPVAGALGRRGRVAVPFPRRTVMEAPRTSAPTEALRARFEQELCRHFGISATPGAQRSVWERRATSSRVEIAGARRRDVVLWRPGPRGDRDRRIGSRRVEEDLRPHLRDDMRRSPAPDVERRSGEDRRSPPPDPER